MVAIIKVIRKTIDGPPHLIGEELREIEVKDRKRALVWLSYRKKPSWYTLGSKYGHASVKVKYTLVGIEEREV